MGETRSRKSGRAKAGSAREEILQWSSRRDGQPESLDRARDGLREGSLVKFGALELWSNGVMHLEPNTPSLHFPNPLKPAIRRRDVDRCEMLLVFVEVGKPHGHAFGQKVVASFGTIA